MADELQTAFVPSEVSAETPTNQLTAGAIEHSAAAPRAIGIYPRCAHQLPIAEAAGMRGMKDCMLR